MRRSIDRRVQLVVLAASVSLTQVAPGSEGPNPGAVFLEIWPEPRATSLAGAMCALADDADATYWNPGGLGFQRSLGGTFSHANWLPGLYPGMYLENGAAVFGLTRGLLSMPTALAARGTYLTTGKTDVIDGSGNYLGTYTTFDLMAGLYGGVRLSKSLGLGLGLKFIYSYLVPDWVFKAMPELGIDAGGTGTALALDAGVLYRPWSWLKVGASLANLGSNISYVRSGESDPLPRTLRLGACFTPLDDPILRARLLLESDKVLVGMFYDPDNTRYFGEELQYELFEAWKSIAVEATLLQFLSVRMGYFEDITCARGGIVVDRGDGLTDHVSLYEYLFRPNQGKFKSLGLCWGLGLSYKDYLRLDLSSDALIYDFSTINVKVGLTATDLGGLISEINRGQFFDWLD